MCVEQLRPCCVPTSATSPDVLPTNMKRSSSDIASAVKFRWHWPSCTLIFVSLRATRSSCQMYKLASMPQVASRSESVFKNATASADTGEPHNALPVSTSQMTYSIIRTCHLPEQWCCALLYTSALDAGKENTGRASDVQDICAPVSCHQDLQWTPEGDRTGRKTLPQLSPAACSQRDVKARHICHTTE